MTKGPLLPMWDNADFGKVPPSTNGRRKLVIFGDLVSGKNKRRYKCINGKPVPFDNAPLRNWVKASKPMLEALHHIWMDMISDREPPYVVQFAIYRGHLRQFDYVNIIQDLLDLMVACEYIKDDDANHILPVFVPYQVDTENPRVELVVL